MQRSGGGLAQLTRPAVSLLLSAALGVAGGALGGALLGPPPRPLRLGAFATARWTILLSHTHTPISRLQANLGDS